MHVRQGWCLSPVNSLMKLLSDDGRELSIDLELRTRSQSEPGQIPALPLPACFTMGQAE